MSVKIYSDQSRQVDWFLRRKTDAVVTINVTQNNAAYNLSSSTFIAEVFKTGESTPFITLTQGSGITNGGASGVLTLSLTDTQLNIASDQYFWKLRTTAPTDYLWFNGKFIVNEYIWDAGTTSATVNVALTVSNTTIDLDLIAAAVTGGISVSTLQNAYNNSTEPEILTDSTRGALTVKRGSAADTDNILEGKNGSDQIKFYVKGDGDYSGNSVTRVISTTTTSSLTPDPKEYDLFEVTALASAITIENPATAPSNGTSFFIRITDNGTARSISYGTKYRDFGKPNTSSVNKTLYIPIVYDSVNDTYDILGFREES